MVIGLFKEILNTECFKVNDISNSAKILCSFQVTNFKQNKNGTA